MQDLISVIIPIYNGEKTLARCLKSVLRQSYQNLEIILINDGSSDRTEEICSKVAEIDTRVKIINQKNCGLSAARNRGLDEMHGKYVTFVDADDYLDLNAISLLYDSIRTLPKGNNISIIPYISESTFGTKIYINSPIEQKILSKEDLFLHYGDRNNTIFVRVCGKLYTASLFHEIRFKEHALYEDVFLFPQLSYITDHVIFTEGAFYHYVQEDGSITRRAKTEKDFQAVDAALSVFDFLTGHNDLWITIKMIQGAEDKIYAKLKEIKFSIEKEKYSELLDQYTKEHQKRLSWLRYHGASTVRKEVRAIRLAFSK